MGTEWLDSATDLEWLNNRLRSIHRISTNGKTEDDGMLRCVIARWGFHQVELRVHSLEELIEKGRALDAHDTNP